MSLTISFTELTEPETTGVPVEFEVVLVAGAGAGVVVVGTATGADAVGAEGAAVLLVTGVEAAVVVREIEAVLKLLTFAVLPVEVVPAVVAGTVEAVDFKVVVDAEAAPVFGVEF